ncbi:hypothetical protein [Amycolatopsis nigrescens]|uniref:hypothetical protein n=1 Tax=Amycolatopsis nigrescens TaxID=381445 RepID=UPI0003A00BEE|nr:hypothetical protein [Amycolatopsis nigrescens]
MARPASPEPDRPGSPESTDTPPTAEIPRIEPPSTTETVPMFLGALSAAQGLPEPTVPPAEPESADGGRHRLADELASPAEEQPRSRAAIRFASGAVVLLAVACGLFFLSGPGDDDRPADAVVQPPVPTATPSPSAPPATAPPEATATLPEAPAPPPAAPPKQPEVTKTRTTAPKPPPPQQEDPGEQMEDAVSSAIKEWQSRIQDWSSRAGR